jgi:hypothetical protein
VCNGVAKPPSPPATRLLARQDLHKETALSTSDVLYEGAERASFL